MIFATGFESGIGDVPGVRNMGYDLQGRGGVTLSEKWSGGPRTFRSYQSRGFPNCMMLNAPQGSFTANNVHNLSEVATHAAHLVAECLESGVRSVEPSEQAEEEYCARMYENSGGGQKFLAMCTPGCKSHGPSIRLCGLILMVERSRLRRLQQRGPGRAGQEPERGLGRAAAVPQVLGGATGDGGLEGGPGLRALSRRAANGYLICLKGCGAALRIGARARQNGRGRPRYRAQGCCPTVGETPGMQAIAVSVVLGFFRSVCPFRAFCLAFLGRAPAPLSSAIETHR
eukprot:COSAG04_NODE_2861_length_3469_cov_10.708012_2_plen_286_part_00